MPQGSSDSDAFAYLRKESLDIYNRIHSIADDIHFVERVREVYPNLPILPNLRCGAWYTNPTISEDIPAYFKSTDGHYNNWSFNLRRANLHLLPFIQRHGGLILVDSTRAGKRIPDALSKTVPIWCCVVNRAMSLRYPDTQRYNRNPDGWDTMLYTPPGSVGMQEQYQIEQRIGAWAKALADSSFDLPPLSDPLRPFWITPSTSAFPNIAGLKFLSVLCISASRQTTDGIERRSGGYTYIQGSADDHELWGTGLEPRTFWKHKDELLSSDRDVLVDLAKSIVSKPSHSECASRLETAQVRPLPALQISSIARVNGIVSIASAPFVELMPLVCSLNSKPPNPDAAIYVIAMSSYPDALSPAPSDPDEGGDPFSNVLLLMIPPGKRGQLQFLQDALPRSMSFIQSYLLHRRSHPRICCICDSNSQFDRSVGIALSALQIFFDDSGNLRKALDWSDSDGDISKLSGEVVTNKKSIQTRLEWIISSEPRVNPSRTTLKRVNEYLMSPKSFRHSSPTSYTG
ncbi:tRNA A64-2'-O-ribosylphosphate transferase [Amanita rubescens]|nr:tRNA A64-2'-O-ribosylphosphate transferase [Amanita rubescens]